MAPRAVGPLPAPLPFILGRVILSLGAVALSGGSPTLAWVVAALIALNTALGVAWGQVALSPRHDGGGPWPQQKLRLEGAGDNR